MTIGTTTWGQDTGTTTDNTRDFTGNWTGTGSITGSGDAEKIYLESGEYMESEVVQTATRKIVLRQNQFGAGDDVTMLYRTGATQVACEAADWALYTTPFLSGGYAQIRLEGGVIQLRVSSNGRYLESINGVPFLMVASSAQCMIMNGSLADAETFLADRQSKGINTIWLELLMNDGWAGRADSSTYDEIVPFTITDDFSTPNEAYFARADAMINLAAAHGMVVLLTPMSTMVYLAAMRTNGNTKCYNFGAYLGNRYKNFPNIIWLNGEDFQTWSTQSDDDLAINLANGILSADNIHIHSVQLDYPTSDSRADADWDDIISLNAVYRYNTQFITSLVAYNRTPAMPFYLSETHYETETVEGDTGTPNVLRRQEYWTMLSGACGQLNGSHYFASFEAGCLDHLSDAGQVQLTYLKELFSAVEWYNLIPDQTHAILTVGYGTSSDVIPSTSDYATCAALADGTLAIIYMPTNRTMTVDMSGFSGSVTCRWFDPTNGTYTADAASPHANSGSHDFSRATTNSAGDADWLLVLEV